MLGGFQECECFAACNVQLPDVEVDRHTSRGRSALPLHFESLVDSRRSRDHSSRASLESARPNNPGLQVCHSFPHEIDYTC